MPGFTRGLDFAGDLGFVGLSQVGESAIVNGLRPADRLRPEERTCGLCVVGVPRGEPSALLQFAGGIRAVFAVSILPRRFLDLING